MARGRTVLEEKKRKLADKKLRNATSAEWVRDARRQLGITQQEFADRLGADRSMVGRWETAVEAPGHTNTQKIHALLRGLPAAAAPPMLKSFPDDGRTDVDLDRMVLEDLHALPAARRLKLMNLIHEEAETLRSQAKAAPVKG